MTLTLHHFRKEMRYLLPRWWLWIILLVIELLLNLEWLLPMNTAGWPGDAWQLTWAVALWLAASHAPEDSPSNDKRFIATRPLPASSYWLARAIMLIVFIALPLAIQEGLYLALSHRAVSAVLAGIWSQGLNGMLGFAWLLPFSALWRRGQAGLGILAIMATIIVNSQFLTILIDAVWPKSNYESSYLLWHSGLGFLALPLFTVLALTHQSRHLKLGWRLTVVSLIAWFVAELSFHWIPHRTRATAFDQTRAEAMAKAARIVVPKNAFSFSPEWLLDATGSLLAEVGIQIKGVPSGIYADVNRRSFSATQEGLPLNAGVSRYASGFYEDDAAYISSGMGILGSQSQAVLRSFPAGTILASARTDAWALDGHEFHFEFGGVFRQPLPANDKPITATGEFDIRWIEHFKAMDLPLVTGSSMDIGTAKLIVHSVHFNENASGDSARGHVSMDYSFAWDPVVHPRGENEFGMMLHSPDRRIVWEGSSMQSYEFPTTRSIRSRWQRKRSVISWKDVTAYADGEDAKVDRAELRLVLMRSRNLGTTSWNWNPEPFVLGDLPVGNRGRRNWHLDAGYDLYPGKGERAFIDRLATIAVPASTALRKEVKRYLFDVFNTANATGWTGRTALAKLDEIATKTAREHLDVMLDLPNDFAGAFPKTFNRALDAVITDAQKPDVLRHVAKNTWLVEQVRKRGWTHDATQLLAEIESAVNPLDPHVIRQLEKINDEPSRQRLLAELKRNDSFYYSSQPLEIAKFLARSPEFRPELKQLADERIGRASRLLHDLPANEYIIATMMGNGEALDFSLLIASMTGETAVGSSQYFDSSELAPLIGLPFDSWEVLNKLPEEERTQRSHQQKSVQFRGLRAANFQYVPDELRWRRKP